MVYEAFCGKTLLSPSLSTGWKLNSICVWHLPCFVDECLSLVWTLCAGCATQPRLLGDGMDSESLKKKLLMPRMSSIGRHTNLTSSDKLASVTKSQKVRFVAREPVRAAVKPLTVDAVKPGGRHMVGDPHTVQHSNPSCSVNMVAPIVSRTCDSVCGTSTVVSMNGGAMPRSIKCHDCLGLQSAWHLMMLI